MTSYPLTTVQNRYARPEADGVRLAILLYAFKIAEQRDKYRKGYKNCSESKSATSPYLSAVKGTHAEVWDLENDLGCPTLKQRLFKKNSIT